MKNLIFAVTVLVFLAASISLALERSKLEVENFALKLRLEQLEANYNTAKTILEEARESLIESQQVISYQQNVIKELKKELPNFQEQENDKGKKMNCELISRKGGV